MTLAEAAGAAFIPGENWPEGMEPGLEETAFYDPENFVFPFGAHAAIVEVDPETGNVDVDALRRGRRLRPGHQPDADRRPGARRHRALDRAGALRADPLRRGRPAGHGHVRRLLPGERGRRPVVRDRPDGDPVAGQRARRQGHRRGRHDRRHGGGHQRGDRRAAARRRHVHEHAPDPERIWEALRDANCDTEGGAA